MSNLRKETESSFVNRVDYNQMVAQKFCMRSLCFVAAGLIIVCAGLFAGLPSANAATINIATLEVSEGEKPQFVKASFQDRRDRRGRRGHHGRQRGDRHRSGRHRGDRHRGRGDRHRGGRHKGDRHRGDRHRGDRHKGDRHRGDRHRRDRHRGDRRHRNKKFDGRKGGRFRDRHYSGRRFHRGRGFHHSGHGRRVYKGKRFNHGYRSSRGHGYFCSKHSLFHYFAGFDPVGFVKVATYSRAGYAYSDACYPVEKLDYHKGRKARIQGILCTDDYGNPYIKRGSRYIAEYIY